MPKPEDPNIRTVSPAAALDAFKAYAGAAQPPVGSTVVHVADLAFLTRDRTVNRVVDALAKAIVDKHGEVIDEDGITIICTPEELRATILAAIS